MKLETKIIFESDFCLVFETQGKIYRFDKILISIMLMDKNYLKYLL